MYVVNQVFSCCCISFFYHSFARFLSSFLQDCEVDMKYFVVIDIYFFNIYIYIINVLGDKTVSKSLY